MDQEYQKKTRLGAIKEAIVDELKRMKFEKDRLKIGIITFGSLVSVFNSN